VINNTVFVKKYTPDYNLFPINKREIMRYAGYRGKIDSENDEVYRVMCEVINELKDSFSYKVCYRRMDIEWNGDMPVLPFESQSKNLAKCLKGSDEIVMFAATVGLGIDRFIAKYQRFSPTKALFAQAYGAERIECLCDVFCGEMKEGAKGKKCTPRFSPGYGDLPIEVQKDFFKLLDCGRQIGISLNESLLMTPSKSVTAIFGIGGCADDIINQGCDKCKKADCEFRSKEV